MKSILVSGAGGHLGQAAVQRLLRDGHTVYAILSPGGHEPAFGPGKLQTGRLDLGDEAAAERYVGQIVAQDPRLDTAVCIAGGWHAGDIAATGAAELERMFRLNFSTAYHLVRPLLAHFERQGGGQFIFIGARPAISPAGAGQQVAYALSKSLLFRLAEIINAQGKPHNIRASVIVPSILDTPPNRAAMPGADPHHWVTPEAAADAIAFLLGETGDMLRETVIKLYNKV